MFCCLPCLHSFLLSGRHHHDPKTEKRVQPTPCTAGTDLIRTVVGRRVVLRYSFLPLCRRDMLRHISAPPQSPKSSAFQHSTKFTRTGNNSYPNRNLVLNTTATRKRTFPPPIYLGSIDEESSASEYYLDLGAESPSASTPNLLENKAFVEQWAAAGVAVPRALPRRPSWRSLSSSTSTRPKKDTVDRDCGIW